MGFVDIWRWQRLFDTSDVLQQLTILRAEFGGKMAKNRKTIITILLPIRKTANNGAEIF
jgi:hypothetical protein